MNEKIKIKTYKKDFDYSYMLGAYGTIELIKTRPELIRAVYIHSGYKDKQNLQMLCTQANVPVCFEDSVFNKISQKENHYVFAVFKKFLCTINSNEPHIVLVNPSDMGNLGTIMRIAAGCNIHNIAIISPSADIWHPKAVRASMGALFKLDFQYFNEFEEYQTLFSKHDYFPFILNAKEILDLRRIPEIKLFSLIFGNEASGLDQRFNSIGTGIKIPQSNAVDSLNLSVAVGIGAFAFASVNGLI